MACSIGGFVNSLSRLRLCVAPLYAVLKLVVNRSCTNDKERKYHVVFMMCYDNSMCKCYSSDVHSSV